MSSEDYTACNSAFGYGMTAADTVGLLAIALALLGLWVAFGKSASTWLGLTAVIAAAGFALAGITNLAEHCLDQSPELPLPLFTGLAENSPYILGLVLALFIFPFAMILTRTSSAPRWSGWMLFIASAAETLHGTLSRSSQR